ncbi:YesL family protein [Alkalihalobacillus hemicellulosilyticus]|uniref:YESV protein n=1 Tax=Halalkalibacter hemicellulosilyticusJCM 9152 TaxID=1236971 RepID=W4QAT9_9BACI|nr:DUF624 domain-containing protein [Halalkalibacter hemicellulosilyticus]GAE28793.1 hypothetical protein JCM9152_127 [Halalkalibacter hemicellulosilyticusJCM 9152]
MTVLNSSLYQTLEKSMNYILLNFLWLLTCLPIVTFFTGTIAMFAVIRDWHMKKDEGVIKPFLKHFKKNIKSSILLATIWLPLTYIMIVNLHLLNPTTSIISLLMTFIIGGLFVIFLYTSLYLFPVFVHFELPVLKLIQNAFFIATSQWKYTIIGLASLLAVGMLLYHFPVLMLFFTSVFSYFIYVICYKSFQQLGASYSG